MRAAGAVALAALAAACSAASTTSVSLYQGTYDLWIVDGSNGCALSGIAEGQTTANISLQVIQDTEGGVPQNMTATIGGSMGKLMSSLVGTNELAGTLGGSSVTLAPPPPDGGEPMGKTGQCTFSTGVTVNLTFGGDTVQGTIVYQDFTNNSTECGSLRNCQTVLAVAGVLARDAGVSDARVSDVAVTDAGSMDARNMDAPGQ